MTITLKDYYNGEASYAFENVVYRIVSEDIGREGYNVYVHLYCLVGTRIVECNEIFIMGAEDMSSFIDETSFIRYMVEETLLRY